MFRSPVKGIRRIKETLALSTLSQVLTFRWTEKGLSLARPGVSTSSDLTLASGRAVGVSSVVFGLRLRVKLWDALLRRFQMYGSEWTLPPAYTSLVPSPSTIISTVVTIITVIIVNRFVVRTQVGSLGVMAARGADGGTVSARRRRERRQRSWWRHEQLSVAAALSAARHHSAGRDVEEVVTMQDGRGRGARRVLRSTGIDATSPGDAASTSGGVPALVSVVMVQEAAHDDDAAVGAGSEGGSGAGGEAGGQGTVADDAHRAHALLRPPRYFAAREGRHRLVHDQA